MHATAQLLAGRSEIAAAELLDLANREANNEDLWNDYAVALYEISLEQDAPRVAVAALAAVDRALTIDPLCPDALFNRATILHELGLAGAAASAWDAFLAVEPSTGWAEEARPRLSADRSLTDAERWKQSRSELLAAVEREDVPAVGSLVRALPQNARTSAEYDLLNGWAEGWISRRPADANRSLRAAELVGAELLRFNGETLVRDAAARAKTLAATDPRSASGLAAAQAAYEKARVLVRDRKPLQAEALLAEADRGFAAAASPMALVARYYHAEALFDLREASRAMALLDSVDSELRPGYHALRANVLLARTRIEGRTGRLNLALEHAMAAAEIFKRQKERDSCARARNEVASLLSMLGRPDEAWRVRRQLFADASRSGSRTLGTALYAAAKDEILLEQLDVARSLFDLFLRQEGSSPLLRFNALLWQAFATTQLQDRGTDDVLDGVTAGAHAISDAALREEALDQLRLVTALHQAEKDPSRALRLLDESIGFRGRTHRLSRLADAHLIRARVLRSTGEADKAAVDYRTALEILERQRTEVRSLVLRDSFFSTADEACRGLVEIEVARGAGARAFDASERCRARSIVDTLSRAGSSLELPRTLDDVQQALPEDVILLHYTVLPRNTLIVAVTRTSRSAVTVAAPAAAIVTLVRRLHAGLQDDDGMTAGEASSALFRLLVAPHGEQWTGRRIVIVPDGVVADIPFAALADPSGVPLVARGEILYAASASAYVAQAELARGAHASPRTLVVGDPTTADPTLAHLPGAVREANAVARLHRDVTLLLREQATLREVFTEARESDLIHIAAHAVINRYDGTRSALRLAPSETDDGAATVEDIANRHLPRAPVVVLAGCSTGVRGEGRGAIRSLALAFLAAGSRNVMGTFWDIPDARGVRFMTEFHRRLLAGDSAPLALQRTQLAWINSSQPDDRLPSAWAAYQVTGYE